MAGGGPAVDARTRILRAAADLLSKGGVDALTTRGVAAAAQVQPPAIYRHFGDKEGLLAAVAEYGLVQSVQGPSAEAESPDPALALAQAWDAHMAFGLAHPAMFALMSRAGHDGTASPAFEAVLGALRQRVRRIARDGRLRISEPLAVQLVHAAGTGAVAALLQSPTEERNEALPATMREAIMAFIVGDSLDHLQTTTASLAIGLRARLDEAADLSRGERALLGELLARLAAPPQGPRS